MAITVISMVPTNSGRKPKAPDWPTWSDRMAICGDHWVPKRKSYHGYLLKKISVSNNTDSTMPTVVRMATTEHPISSHRTIRSTILRARNCGLSRETAHKKPIPANARPVASSAQPLAAVSHCMVSAARLISGLA